MTTQDENFIGLLLIPNHKAFCHEVFVKHLLGGACGKTFKIGGVSHTLNCRGENEWYVMMKVCIEPCFRDPKQACCGMPQRFSSVMPCRTRFAKTGFLSVDDNSAHICQATNCRTTSNFVMSQCHVCDTGAADPKAVVQTNQISAAASCHTVPSA